MRGRARIALGIASVLAAALNFTACGSSTNDSMVSGGTAAAAGAAGAAGAAAAGNSSGAANSSGGSLNVSSGGGTGDQTGVGGGDACAADVSTGKLVPLDMYIMLDTSSSMLDLTGTNVSKWDAVKTALETFLKDQASAGLGVGLQYFPLSKPNAPTSCAKDSDCPGDMGPCFLKWCYQAAVQVGVVPCETNGDCGNLGPCTTVAQCSKNTDYICTNIGAACSKNDPTLGTCTAAPPSICEHTASCDIPTYATPAEPIAVLPGAAAALTASIDAKTPNGNTPTAPALSGAIQEASAWAKAHPDHRVVTLLATDGLPTECIAANVTTDAGAVAEVGGIAAMGLAATPSISTFVIGVFGPNDVAQMAPGNLDTIAKDGGTMSAFIVDTTKDVTAQFLAALNAIRGGKLECAFQIPQPTGGQTLDYKKVNVSVKTASGTTDLYYVGGAAQCDPTTGGWYYDADPDMGGTPTQIIACPTSCTAFQGVNDASVEIALGCLRKIVVK